MTTTARSLAAGAAALALVVAGCGSSSSNKQAAKPVNPNAPEALTAGDIPDNQAYVAFKPPGANFSVKVPEGWAQTANSAAVTFTDKLNSVRMESQSAGAPLTAAKARSALLPQLSKTVKGFAAGKVSVVQRKAGTAVRTTYQATSAADPVTGKTRTMAVERYDFFHKGKDVVLTLSGAKGADNVDPWRIVTDSLRFTA
jgi:hypothetical protein